MPGAVAHAAHRVVQESLTNALRYAAGAAVRVRVRGDAETLELEVVNGPAPRAAALAGMGTGNGLRGLRERVQACGGRLDAGPLPRGRLARGRAAAPAGPPPRCPPRPPPAARSRVRVPRVVPPAPGAVSACRSPGPVVASCATPAWERSTSEGSVSPWVV